MLDNIKVVLGDQVWDTLWGQGTVVELTPEGDMVVQFSTRKMRYISGGYIGTSSVRRLYWQDYTRLPSPLPGSVGVDELRLVSDYWIYIRRQRGVPERLPGITEAKASIAAGVTDGK